jgi:hypothetical protein
MQTHMQMGFTHFTRSSAGGAASSIAAGCASGMAAADDIVSDDGGNAARASAAAMAASVERRGNGAMISSFDRFSIGVATACLDKRLLVSRGQAARRSMGIRVIPPRRNFACETSALPTRHDTVAAGSNLSPPPRDQQSTRPSLRGQPLQASIFQTVRFATDRGRMPWRRYRVVPRAP